MLWKHPQNGQGIADKVWPVKATRVNQDNILHHFLWEVWWVARSKVNHRIMPLWHEKCCPKEIKSCTKLQVLTPTLGTEKTLEFPFGRTSISRGVFVYAQWRPGRHIRICALPVPAQQECKQDREAAPFSSWISWNHPSRNHENVSCVSTLCVHVLWQKKEIMFFASEPRNREQTPCDSEKWEVTQSKG